jgi:AraC-like DNA-binding protein
VTDEVQGTVERLAGDGDGGPAVAVANWYRFRPAEVIENPEVFSLLFIWAVSGSGTVTARGQTFTLKPGMLLRLPWHHDVRYVADARHPFHVGSVHVIPWHSTARPLVAFVPHRPGDELRDSPYRRGDRTERPHATALAQNGPARALVDLASYAVEAAMTTGLEEPAARAVATLLLREDERSRREGVPSPQPPSRVGAMTDHIVEHLDQPLALADIARVGGCSTATAERLFRLHKGISPSAWMRGERMRTAALLLRTTGLSVGEVARRVGYADPLYFSRVFRKEHGVPPSRYAGPAIRP